MLMKYIDKKDTTNFKHKLPTFQKNFYKYKMTDFQPDNMINGIIVDIGMIIKNEHALKSDKFRHNLFKFLRIIEKNHEENFTTIPFRNLDSNLANDTKKAILHAEEFVDILMKKGIDIYNVDIRKYTENISPLEQKYVISKIRKLKKAHNLKYQLEQRGEYHKYKNIVENYVRTFGSWTLKQEFL